MVETRENIVALLRQAAAGTTPEEGRIVAAENARGLSVEEKKALHALRHYLCDADLREEDPESELELRGVLLDAIFQLTRKQA